MHCIYRDKHLPAVGNYDGLQVMIGCTVDMYNSREGLVMSCRVRQIVVSVSVYVCLSTREQICNELTILCAKLKAAVFTGKCVILLLGKERRFGW